MQRFIKVKENKNYKCPPYYGNYDTVQIIRSYIEQNKVFFIFGETGCGKTHIINHCVRGHQIIHLTFSTLKSKLKMKNFIETVRGTDNIIIIDEFDTLQKSDFFGWKELLQYNYKLSNCSTIVIGKYNKKFKDMLSVEIKPPTESEILQISPCDPNKAKQLWKICNGDVKMYLNNLNGIINYEKDNFMTPKQLVRDCLTKPKNKELFKYIYQGIEEHGYIWNSIHGNYLSLKGNIDYADIALIMSNSDILDIKIYNESWLYMPFFISEAIIRPNMLFDKPLKNEIKPGSAWTKHNNFKMKKKKMKNITNKLNIHSECLDYIRHIPYSDLSIGDRKFLNDSMSYEKKHNKKNKRNTSITK